MMAYTTPALATPSRCMADFSLIPIGSQTASFSQQIANIQRLIQQSGLKFQMHATGTTIGSVSLGSHSLPYPSRLDVFKLESADGEKFTTTEGPWDQVVQLIGFAHTFVHQQGIARVQTDIRIQTRTDKVQPMEGNVASVERILSAA